MTNGIQSFLILFSKKIIVPERQFLTERQKVLEVYIVHHNHQELFGNQAYRNSAKET